MMGIRKLLSIALVVLISLGLINVVPLVVPSSASSSSNSLEEWLYRKPITVVERSGSDLYNYSLEIAYDLRELIESRKMRAGLEDLRFADSNGDEIPFWIERVGNISRLYDFSKDQCVSYLIVNNTIYGMCFLPTPSAVWKYDLITNNLTFLYNDTNRFTAWIGVYNETEGKVYAVGQYYDGSVYRSAVFIINVRNDSVTYIRHPDTGDCNEFIGVAEWKGYLIVGERIYGGDTSGSSYPNGGGVWFIPKSTITNTSTWIRKWEEPNYLQIDEVVVYKEVPYILASGYPDHKPGFVEIWKYDEANDTFTLFLNLTGKVTESMGFPAGIDVLGDKLYITYVDTEGKLRVITYDGSTISDINTGITVHDTWHLPTIALNMSGTDVLVVAITPLPYTSSKLYLYVPSTNTSLLIGELPYHAYPLKKWMIDYDTLTIYQCVSSYVGGKGTSGESSLYTIELYRAKIWVKLPYIPALGTVTIYMYYDNPTAMPSNYTARDVFLWYDDFSDSVLDPAYVVFGGASASEANGVVTLQADTALDAEGLYINSSETYVDQANPPAKPWIRIEVKARTLETVSGNDQWGVFLYWSDEDNYVTARYIDDQVNSVFQADIMKSVAGTKTAITSASAANAGTGWYNFTVIDYLNGTIRFLLAGEGQSFDLKGTQTDLTKGYIGLFVGWDDGEKFEFDYIIVRAYVDPPPKVSIGAEESTKAISLPQESLILVHDIAYSPNSTQFSHSFSATNTTTAGYETGYSDIYGWRVYADPYQSGGTSYENSASLVSEVNISLPYTEVLVKNVTLLARTNGTGAVRQLWVKVLNSTGGVVAEVTNATVSTDWTEVTLVVNANLSNQITVWINATVKSTTTAGEELGVKDVRIYIEYSTNPKVTVAWAPNVEYFNCSASHYVELGSTSYLNTSLISLKLIQYLTYNTTDYPTQPVYVGNETIGAHNYTVYVIDPANYSQTMTVYALLENKLKTMTVHVKGYVTDKALIGESVTIDMPVPGNITIVELNETYINVTTLTLKFFKAGVFTVVANTTEASKWSMGYVIKSVTVKYGEMTVKPVDIDARTLDYEDITLQLVNETGAVVKEVYGRNMLYLSGLPAGNYSLRALFKGVVIGARDFTLNITTDSSIVDLDVNAKLLPSDYRGLNKSIIFGINKSLVTAQSLSSKYPYSRMKIQLDGTGSFTLFIDYAGDLPTAVSVTGNVSGLSYYWDGNYLVITGSLGSVGEINVTDLYRIRVESYDRLGNRMPSWIYAVINGSRFYGSVVEGLYYPEDYVIEVPQSINGFEFYGFFDGFNSTVRHVALNNTDVTLKVWYRVPTEASIKSYQVSSLWFWRLPLLSQEEGETVKVYVEGYLRDYYGNGVPSREVTVKVINTETGYARTYTVKTDATGYFRTPVMELLKGVVYKVEVSYGGDDVYVGTYSTTELTPEELPVVPPPAGIPVEFVLLGVAAAVVVVGVFAAVRAVRHVVEDTLRRRKFVRRK